MNHPSGSDDYSGSCHSVYFLNSFISCVGHCLEYISGADLVVGEKVEEELRVDEVEVEGIPLIPEVLAVSDDTTQPPPLELKVLPSHLEYAFLGEGSELPVIISSKLEDERSEKEVISGPSLEEAIGPKCGDPPDRRVDDLGKRVKCVESKIEALSKAQCGDRFRFEMYKFKPPDDELKGCERYAGIWIDSDNNRYDGATAREVWYGGELRLHDHP
ncbi:hypothetical protein HanXRQr2_Chr14g0637751 [Helianthus annuus]|uniref:Uncharacterized protein n=1 Tax=Helianthus annuus TaxID=4232 RepID=A0A9K3H767_HELAN|nr:hypothetical protein HanXRQr2_Chr14g0637751 [Helianthus annuus]